MKIALIVPKWPEGSLWGKVVFRFPYLALTSLAALTPDNVSVKLVDENVDAIDWGEMPDLVGISLMTPLAPRGYEIASDYRKRGIPVVLGGIHPTMMPVEAGTHADAVVAGEGEHIWAQVIDDALKGRLQPLYRGDNKALLERLPIPRRELSKRQAYFFVNTVQTTRGCPFDCEFCSMTVSFQGVT